MYHNFESFVLCAREAMLIHSDWLCEKYIKEKVCVWLFLLVSQRREREKNIVNDEKWNVRIKKQLIVLIYAINFSEKNVKCKFRFQQKEKPQRKHTKSFNNLIFKPSRPQRFFLRWLRIHNRNKKFKRSQKKRKPKKISNSFTPHILLAMICDLVVFVVY